MASRNPDVVFFNGRFISAQEAQVCILEPAFLYGFSLFETMRSYKGKIIYRGAHLKRLEDSAQLLNINLPYPKGRIDTFLEKTIRLNGYRDSYVRLTLWKQRRGSGMSIIVRPYRKYPLDKYKQGFSVCISDLRQVEDWTSLRIKSGNYLFYYLAFRQARSRGFDEAMILNSRGFISEGSRSNLFLVKDGELFTPSAQCGPLMGITRRVIMDLAQRVGIKVYEASLTPVDLQEADEAFLTNSLIGVMPLTYIEKKIIGRGRCGYLSRFFMNEYNKLLKS
jgi:branched-subunit amino acid aminotransferase/4-amino-4-deoxychorismate lyase